MTAGSARAAALDLHVLRELEAELGGTDGVRQVIVTFLDGSPRFLTGLRDAAAIRQAAHALRSSSALLGAITLSTRCEELERESRAGTVIEAVARVTAIDDLYRVVTLALEAEAASLAAGGSAAQAPPPDPT